MEPDYRSPANPSRLDRHRKLIHTICALRSVDLQNREVYSESYRVLNRTVRRVRLEPAPNRDVYLMVGKGTEGHSR